MRLALCNEILDDRDLAAQCAYAAELGYEGLELAPYTMDEQPHRLPAARRRDIRRTVEAAGLRVSGLHWLLVKPEGLSLTDPDAEVRARTVEVMCELARLCGDLGGDVLVHGSPKQRWIPDDPVAAAAARHWALDAFAKAGDAAREAGVTYCIEALAPPHANFITTVAEAAAIVDEIGNPALRTMIDTGAARANPGEAPVEELVAAWYPSGHVAHIQFRDRTRRGPGQGDDDFAGVIDALRAHGYDGWIAVEPIELDPDGPTVAAFCADYLRPLLET
ncbi:MAG: sugar phosphate isomerase/epimerase [Alphaproteobacteria bacterium]|nr:sugar phosphate isomerase/epimerase [Alphaproteobacteria bacterium]